MYYTNLLKQAKEQNVDIASLNMAYEVECALDEQEVPEEHFETICNHAYNLWLKLDFAAPCQCAKASIDAYNDNTFEHFKSLDKYQLANYVEIY